MQVARRPNLGVSPVPAASGYDVMVVEDDAPIREALAEAFSQAGLRASTASNGHEALALLEATGAEVVVCDLVMPVMNGWELAEALRARPKLRHLPILFVTAVANADRVPPGPIFFKPLHFASLLRAVKIHLGQPAD